MTVLTSLDADDLAAIGAAGDVAAQVERLARVALAKRACAPFVCSPHEAALLRKALGPGRRS